MVAPANTITSQKRSDALAPPPKDALMKALNVASLRVEWLAGDGSDRCYYRLESGELAHPLVLMQLSENDAVKLREDGYDWLKVARILKSQGLRVPAPIVSLNEHAALVIEDYGDVMLESIVHQAWKKKDLASIEKYYRSGFDIIVRMLKIPRNNQEIWCTRAFDFEKYSWELRFFRKEYLQAALQLNFSATESEQFNEDVTALCEFLAGFSHYFVHRDFHSRNIMVKDGDLALIDFQDARLGAIAYDLVSLIFDNYVPFDLAYRKHLLDIGIKTIVASLDDKAGKELKQQLGAVILQRQLKAIGTYGFLTINKKRGDYLGYVTLALDTLASGLVYDKRWAFLSDKLLKMMRNALSHGK